MIRTGVSAWIVALIMVGIFGFTAAEQDVREAVMAANKAWQMRDAAAYAKLIADDFVRVPADGRITVRGDWLAMVGEAGPARPVAKFDEEVIRVYGNGAIMSYRNFPQEPGKDGKLPPPNRLTRILERQGNRWVLVLAQDTPIAEVFEIPATSVEAAKADAWTPATAIEKEALETFLAIQKANREYDIAAWERLSAPEHTIIRTNGNIMKRAERIEQLKTPATQTGAATSPDQGLRIRMVGDLAVATWIGGGGSRSLKVLAKTSGHWRQVWQQATPILNP